LSLGANAPDGKETPAGLLDIAKPNVTQVVNNLQAKNQKASSSQ